MKTIQSLVSVALTGLFVAVATISAAEPLLSPRAKENRIPKTSGVIEEERLDRSFPTAPPKFLEHRVSYVSGTTEDRIDRRLFSASPRALENFPNLAAVTALPTKSSAGMMACCPSKKANDCCKHAGLAHKAQAASMSCCV